MAQQTRPISDPWKELARDCGNAQVELDEVFHRFNMEDTSVQAVKRALMARLVQLTHSQ